MKKLCKLEMLVIYLLLSTTLQISSSTVLEVPFKSFDVELDENFHNQTLPDVLIENIDEIFANASISNSKVITLSPKGRRPNKIVNLKSVANKESSDLHKLASVSFKTAEVASLLYSKNQKYQNTYRNVLNFISKIKIPPKYCVHIKEEYCYVSDPYRSINGLCNNLKNSWYGQRLTPYQRLLTPEYDDHIYVPRTYNGRLPSARVIAFNLFTHNPTVSEHSSMLVYFGQFIAHDMTQIVDSGASCDCETENPECYNIPIADEDYQFIKDLCIPFARSSASPPLLDCYLKPREQMNRMTHFLDLSQLYGTTNEDSMNLRTGYHGLLKSSRCPGSKYESLPLFDQTKKCPFGKKWDCFSTGDDRAEINENLLGIHSIFLREHNRIAKRLFHLNPHWYDEKLYQEARSILIGMYQNIVYDHFLSYLLGEELVKNYKLNVSEKGYTYEYNEHLYPQVLNEFATASFRLHFLVPNYVKMASADFRPIQSKLLNHSIFNASNAYLNMDSISRGSLIEPAYKASLQMADSLHNHLFEDTFIQGKSSLGALNIQRGRDHGIPSYNRYRAFCGLNYAKDFEDLSSNMDYETIIKLKEAYKNVEDIDLYVGGASERRIKGGLLGATFSCINAYQFYLTKFGDRFWFENGDNVARFSLEQLKEIRKSSLIRILCDSLGLEQVQLDPFLIPDSKFNPFVRCSEVNEINLGVWKEKLERPIKQNV